jgi:hypothetical protein
MAQNDPKANGNNGSMPNAGKPFGSGYKAMKKEIPEGKKNAIARRLAAKAKQKDMKK